eukprot:s481_g25.t4
MIRARTAPIVNRGSIYRARHVHQCCEAGKILGQNSSGCLRSFLHMGGEGGFGKGGFGDKGKGKGKKGKGKGKGKGKQEEKQWVPMTKLGRLVNDNKINNLEEIYLHSLPIKEPEIIDHFYPPGSLKDEVLKIHPVQKMTSAGQTNRFVCYVLVGDTNGHIGLGSKCAKEVATAIRGGIIAAKLNLIPVRRGFWGNRIGLPHTVPMKVHGKCGSVRARLIPAPRGSGIVGSPVMKKMMAFAGISDCFTCSCGHTRTTANFAKATFEALKATYGYLTPDLWTATRFTNSPSCGHTRTTANFAKATFEALKATYGYLTPDLWTATRFTNSPFQEFTDYLAQSKKSANGPSSGSGVGLAAWHPRAGLPNPDIHAKAKEQPMLRQCAPDPHRDVSERSQIGPAAKASRGPAAWRLRLAVLALALHKSEGIERKRGAGIRSANAYLRAMEMWASQ